MVFPEPAGILTRPAILDGVAAAPRWERGRLRRPPAAPLPATRRRCSPTASTPPAADGAPYRALCSSTYVRLAGAWWLVQHQQTPGLTPTKETTMPHPALIPDAVAVVTGGASGIGLAAAQPLRGGGAAGLHRRPRRRAAGARRPRRSPRRRPAARTAVMAVETDVGRRRRRSRRSRRRCAERFGGTDVLMNNAGIGPDTGVFGPADAWARTLAVNLWGVIHGTQAFVPGMIARGRPGLVVNTGSKQGITTPPGNPAYNVSKAGVKVFTEALAHELRNTEGCRITAHLLIPGFVFTGLTRGDRREKPPAAWTPEQTVDFMLDAARGRRLLHPLPGQRRAARARRAADRSGRPATSSRTARRCRAGTRTTPRPSRPSSSRG